jgi:uncharacterized RDD family membrane protein YckC
MNWYYADGSTPKGPFSDEDFLKLVQQGFIQENTLVWHEGLSEWQSYSSIPEYSSTSVTPAVLPPTSPVSSTTMPSTEMAYAGFWIRFVATILDGLILTIPFYVITFAFESILKPSHEMSLALIQIGLMLLQLMIDALYEIILVARYGATLGKMAVGLKVVTADGEPISYGRSTGRYFAKILSELILFIGYVMVAFNREKCGLHDFICETRVIKRR